MREFSFIALSTDEISLIFDINNFQVLCFDDLTANGCGIKCLDIEKKKHLYVVFICLFPFKHTNELHIQYHCA